jgi:hypothetical protein
MTDQTITDLRRRMLQDMTNRNFLDKTKHDYIRHVEALAKFLGRSPDTVRALPPADAFRPTRLPKAANRRR